MKTTRPAIGLLLALALAGCSPTPPVLVPKSPHGGTLFGYPEGKKSVEVLRQDAPDQPGKIQLVAYFLDDQLRPLIPAPVAVSFVPKAPRGAAKVELKPTTDADPANPSSLASPPLDDPGELAGELTATIDGKPMALSISVR